MSGHSKWSTIKRQKGKADAARANVFTKIGREIAVAVKLGGPDPNVNSKLRDLISKAKSNNIPNDNITRSIKKASGEMGSITYESITYEGYGIGGTAVIVEALTDNKNRTASDVRHIFDKCGGNMGTTGCVSYLFDTKGIITFDKKAGSDDDEMMMLSLECGAEDFNATDDGYEVTASQADYQAVHDSIEAKGIEITFGEVQKLPQATVRLEADKLDKFMRMLDMFDENDDVQEVFHNAELPETDEEE